MSLVIEQSEKIEDDILKTSLYTLYADHIVINCKEGEKVFNLNEISDIRLQKKRNFSINIFILFFTLLIYSITFNYFDRNFIYYSVIVLFTVALGVISLRLKRYNYMLFFNTSGANYIKLRMTKNDLPYSLHLVSLFKSGYLHKNN